MYVFSVLQEIHKSNFRITSLMLQQGQLWVGTGGGRVLVFSYDHDPVLNMSEAIQALVSRRKDTKEGDTPSLESMDGGLLCSTVVVRSKEEGEPKALQEEGWVNLEVRGPVSVDVPEKYKRRRKTQFGKTLRNKSYKRSKSKELPDIYNLKLETCSDTITAPNESVRVLLPLR